MDMRTAPGIESADHPVTEVRRCVTLARMTLEDAPSTPSRMRSALRPLAFILAGLVIGVGVTAAAAYSLTPTYEKLPACVEEDGNKDGKPCWWTDPDTGTRYYVTSENYRDETTP
jgi:hypothetical protein